MDEALELLVQEIWRDLDGQVTHEQIRHVASQIATQFNNATVTTFVPIFIRRQTRETLRLVVEK
jgi:hypothetical protein